MTMRDRLRALRSEQGIGLIELLIALTILAVGIAATTAVFASSLLDLQHSSKEGTAITLADRQLESYRAMPFNCLPDDLVVDGAVRMPDTERVPEPVLGKPDHDERRLARSPHLHGDDCAHEPVGGNHRRSRSRSLSAAVATTSPPRRATSRANGTSGTG